MVGNPSTVQQDANISAEAKRTAGQRTINAVWETTQALIAIAVTIVTLYVAYKNGSDETLSSAFFLIIGFYFGRTNHERMGGIGQREIGR